MARVKTFTNGGSLLPSDLNAIQDDYEYAFSVWTDVLDFNWIHLDAPSTGVYYWGRNGNPIPVTLPSSVYQLGVFYFDPAWYTANTRTVKLRITAEAVGNSVNSGQSGLQPQMFQVGTWAGGSSTSPTISAASSAVGNAAVIGSLSSTPQHAEGNVFTAPAAGWYIIGVNVVGSFAAGSYAACRTRLQRQSI